MKLALKIFFIIIRDKKKIEYIDIKYKEENNKVQIIEDTFKHFGKEENQAVRNIIKKNSIPVKENYNDYYEDTSNKIEKIDISNFPKRNNSLKKTALKVNEIIDKINGGD